MDEWEYKTEFVWADIDGEGVKEYIKQEWPNWQKPPKYTPRAMIPELNDFGKKGWELVHLQPANVGHNHDVGHGGDSRQFSNIYFCVFKRRVQK